MHIIVYEGLLWLVSNDRGSRAKSILDKNKHSSLTT